MGSHSDKCLSLETTNTTMENAIDCLDVDVGKVINFIMHNSRHIHSRTNQCHRIPINLRLLVES